jgi:hypothetical protein
VSFTAKIWNNGHYHATGTGYGIKISLQDRERYFDRNWQTVILHLSGIDNPVEVNVAKPSFWNLTCRELIKKEIGIWYLRSHLPRWTRGNPPLVRMKQIANRDFFVEFI